MNLQYKIGNQSHYICYLNNNYNQISKDLDKLRSDKKLLFLFDKNISKEVRNKVGTALKFSGCKVFEIEFIGSKKNKSLKAVLKIIDFMISKGFTRKSTILSMGGGVLGDLSALAASLYMRGTIYFHIPTTMTSMVDSAIGGKTAINYQNIINSIGTYYHANNIYILNDVIKLLPYREFYSGIPEILKCGLLKDESIIKILKKHHEIIKKKNIKYVKELCFKSLKTKINFFKNDITEQKERLMLNFGHTFAHAIEMASEKNNRKNFEILRHGEAVGIGILCEMYYASNLKENNLIKKTKEILNLYKLPINLKFLNFNKSALQNDIFKFLFLDKKKINKHPRYIKLVNFGKPTIEEMQDYDKINFIISKIL
tara:strand:- start:513 stop:1622 length:1110 start_codon:yes stop_codon:yes gene_type:complete